LTDETNGQVQSEKLLEIVIDRAKVGCCIACVGFFPASVGARESQKEVPQRKTERWVIEGAVIILLDPGLLAGQVGALDQTGVDLLPDVNLKLRPKLLKDLKVGSRI
jgi:hypothetical protein